MTPRQIGVRLVSIGRGRALAAVLFVAAGLLLIWQDHTPLVRLQHVQFDQYQRQMPREREAEPVVVVGIDSRSIEALGRWPWSRAVMARLVDKITAGQPLAVGFDVLFSEPDHYSREVMRQQFPDWPATQLNRYPDPDLQLAEALLGEPTVLAAIGLTNALPGARLPGRSRLGATNVATLTSLTATRYSSSLLSLPAIETHAAGIGIINAGVDAPQATEKGVVRSVPAVAFLGDQPVLSLPLDMARVALQWKNNQQTPPIEIVRRGSEPSAIAIGDLTLPLQANGEVLLHFGRAKSNYYVSASDVLAGQHDGLFANRFVLVGINTAFEDRIVTPRGDNLPGVDVHVQVLESLLDGHALRRPGWMASVELAAFAVGALALLAAIPWLAPRFALIVLGGAAVLLIGSGYALFAAGGWLFDGLSVTVFLVPGFVALLSSTLVAADRERKQAEADLRASRESAAFMAGELDAARRIQLGLLPNPQVLFAGETRFAIATLLEPAKAVGGDYYDCFMLDDRRLCLAIGDVAGKGVPASLFMAISKTLTGALARRHTDLGATVQDVERELNRENPEFLFVTSFVAVLDAESGVLTYVCAGHDAPLRRRGGVVERLELTEAGPPLCALGDFPYGAGTTQLEPGDVLCLFTDGVTEATDGIDLFGGEALIAELADCPDDAPVDAMLDQIYRSVRAFESGLPAADDLTLVVLRWHGGTA